MELDELRLMVAAPIYATILDRGRDSPYPDLAELEHRKQCAAVVALHDADLLIKAERDQR